MTTVTTTFKSKLENLIPFVTRAARLSPEEEKRLLACPATGIITATAYLSGCREPERIIASHLLTLLADMRTEGLYSHRAGESLAARLEAGNHYPGGDPEVVRGGMLLLELLSLKDHRHDLALDIAAGKQNPLIVDMDYQEELERIVSDFHLLPASVQKGFGDLFDKTISASFWS